MGALVFVTRSLGHSTSLDGCRNPVRSKGPRPDERRAPPFKQNPPSAPRGVTAGMLVVCRSYAGRMRVVCELPCGRMRVAMRPYASCYAAVCGLLCGRMRVACPVVCACYAGRMRLLCLASRGPN